jgi:hypothetical protein
MGVRLVDFHDADLMLAWVARERRGVRAAGLDRDRVDLTEGAQPFQRPRVTGGVVRKATRPPDGRSGGADLRSTGIEKTPTGQFRGKSDLKP